MILHFFLCVSVSEILHFFLRVSSPEVSRVSAIVYLKFCNVSLRGISVLEGWGGGSICVHVQMGLFLKTVWVNFQPLVEKKKKKKARLQMEFLLLMINHKTFM